MIRLVDVDEGNWLDVRALSVGDGQKGFLDSAVGIIARGYVYRSCRARVMGIEADGTIVGVALVRDLDEEPVCYDLQQLMIDARHQGRGIGSQALRLIIAELAAEQKYDHGRSASTGTTLLPCTSMGRWASWTPVTLMRMCRIA